MEILKQGKIENIRKPKEFSCKKCGCIFRADNTEYKMADYWANVHDGIEAECECPTCGATAYYPR